MGHISNEGHHITFDLIFRERHESIAPEKMVSRFHEVNELYDGTLNAVHTYAFSAITLDMSNNEVFTYTKAMQQPDSKQFIDAMAKEIKDHESRHHWAIVRQSTIPPGHKTIPSPRLV